MRAVLAPVAGEWAVPVRVAGWQLAAGVPSLLRLATSPWAGPLLHGRRVDTRAGRVHFAWNGATQTLALHCAPCRVRAPALGEAPLVLAQLTLSVHRVGDTLTGAVAAGALQGQWSGRLTPQGLQLRVALPMSPIANGYALFAPDIPELAQARIDGRFGFTALVSLPHGSLTVQPQIEGFEVSGLGTERFAHAHSRCTPPTRPARLPPDSWLARAVIAAEDQRFFEHPGYDLAELATALTANQREGRPGRGASTVSQQLAKLLVTGDERSAARKLRELLYAVEMERTLGKPRILGLYLAHAPWGPGLCGAEAATRRYFGVAADQLTPTQAAWLAAMLHNPAVEAQRWQASGQVNLARAQWVVMGMRGLSRRERVALAQQLAARPLAPPQP